MRATTWYAIVGLFVMALAGFPIQSGMAQTGGSRYFPETRHTVKGVFLKYWQENGGLPQQGYPLTEEFTETSDLDGKSYQVQYFERAVFEKHPENPAPYDVLLSQLGMFQFREKYGPAGAPDQTPNTQSAQLFPETGYYVGGNFLEYWKQNGGLAQQGFPISNEFTETSDLDGKLYTVQYFERAVFEAHPEEQPPYNVLLSQLGTFQLRKKYPGGAPGGEGQPEATAPAARPTGTASGTNCKPVDDGKKAGVSSTGTVAISNVQYSGQEYVELKNNGGASADLSRWGLRDKNEPEQRYTFPGGTSLPAGGAVQVYTEPGHPYTFNSRGSIWNNCGDALELLDAGGSIVATYAYGTHLLP